MMKDVAGRILATRASRPSTHPKSELREMRKQRCLQLPEAEEFKFGAACAK